MRDAPILLIGGSGVVGRRTARLLRDANPDAKLLIGGRDLARAQQVAAEIGSAEGVAGTWTPTIWDWAAWGWATGRSARS